MPLTIFPPVFLIFFAVMLLTQGRAADNLVLGYTNLNGAKVPVPLSVDERIFAK